MQVVAFSNLDSGSIEPQGSEVSRDESSEGSLEGSSRLLRACSQHHMIDMPGRQKSQVRPTLYCMLLWHYAIVQASCAVRLTCKSFSHTSYLSCPWKGVCEAQPC